MGVLSPEEKFGAAVRRAREQRGWSQEALAKELSLHGVGVGGQSGIARIEGAERPTRLNEVVLIGQFLGLDLVEVCAAEKPSRVEELLVDIRGLLTEIVAPARAERDMLRRLPFGNQGAPGE